MIIIFILLWMYSEEPKMFGYPEVYFPRMQKSCISQTVYFNVSCR